MEDESKRNQLSEQPQKILTEPRRSQVHITHTSVALPKVHATFALTNKKPKFPSDLYESGTLIYSLRDPILHPTSVASYSDKVLRFDSRFESGNLLKAYHLSGDSYHLLLEPDCNKSGSCQWFYFQIKNVCRNVKYTFNISGFHKFGGVFTSGAKVFMYSEQYAKHNGTSWFRDGTNYQFGITQRGEQSKRSTLQFQMKFDYDNDTVYFAYGTPYTYSYLLNCIQFWSKNYNSIFSHENICKSFGGRNCPLLTITNRAIPESNKEYMMFTGRCHPGESNGSVVLHGLIEFFLSSSPSASFIRNHYIIKIVPMICIDGVIEGFYRICLCGSDLNRMWANPDKLLHPTVYYTKKLIKKFKPVVYIDFHGHSRANGTFAFGCPNGNNISNDDQNNKDNHNNNIANGNNTNRDREKVLPKIISYTSSAFTYNKCIFTIPPARQTASRCVAKLEFGILQSFTIETSFGGVINGKFSSVLYDEAIWRQIGKDIGESIFNLFTPDVSKSRTLAEKELKLTPTVAMSAKSSAKGMLSTQSIKIMTPVKMNHGFSTGSLQVIHNRTPQKQQICRKMSASLSILES